MTNPTKPDPTPTDYDIGRAIWTRLPKKERTARKMVKKFAEVGVQISKSTTAKWMAEWQKEAPVRVTAQVLLTAPVETEPSAESVVVSETIDNLPQALRDALDPRVSLINRVAGLDAVEAATVKVAEAIGSKAPQLAELLLDSENETVDVTTAEGGVVSTRRVQKAQVAKSAVQALSVLATTLRDLAQARAVISQAHKTFSEGDMLGALSRKQDAKARAIFDEGRADRATEITPIHTTPEDEADALASLQAQAQGK